jgi:hypothetical protein
MRRSGDWGGGGDGDWDWGREEFCSRSRFSRDVKKMGTQTTKMAASVYRARSCLAPFVIDLNGEAAGDKKNNRSNG